VGHALTEGAVVVADGGERAGLGHLSRAGAVAAALRVRGYDVECFAAGASERLTRDNLEWAPLEDTAQLAESHGRIVVLDSYRLDAGVLRTLIAPRVFVVLHDAVDIPAGVADLAVTVPPPRDAAPQTLSGIEYACLRPAFWGVRRPQAPRVVKTVAVTSGGIGAGLGELAAAVRTAIPAARIRAVRGPYASEPLPESVEAVDHPLTLLDVFLDADLVVTAGGQTMLEAVATGAPCLAFAQVENQQRQLDYLASLGAVEVLGDDIEETLSRVAGSPEKLGELSQRASAAVDGLGALRVAFAIDQVARGRRL
jgi:UDP-2,4-diacetamido-2,4,6-trideoxy-beta-L-altropyranose hydrolase